MTQDSQNDTQTTTKSDTPEESGESRKLDHLSPSSVKEYNECGLKWYKSRVLKEKPYPSRTLIRNNNMHETLLKFYMAQPIDSRPKLKEIVCHYEENFDASIEDLQAAQDSFGINAVKWIKEQVTKFAYSLELILGPLKDVTPYKIEEPVSGTIGGFKVEGRYDWSIPINEGEIEIWDYKNKPRSIGDTSQNITYAILAPETVRNVGNVSVKHFKNNIRPHAPVWTPVTETEINRVNKIYERTGKSIESGVFLPTFKEADCCGWYCPYWRKDARDYSTGASIACEYGEMSERSVSPPSQLPRYDGLVEEPPEPQYPADVVDDDLADEDYIDDDDLF